MPWGCPTSVVLLALMSLLFSRSGHCEEPYRVVVIRSPQLGPLFIRMHAEIRIAGFDVAQLDETGVLDDHSIEEHLHDACAVVFARTTLGMVDLYYRVRDGQVLHTEMPIPQSSEEEQVMALHIAEVLRITFMTNLPSVKSQSPPPDNGTPQAPIRISDALTGRLGLSFLWGMRGMPPQPGVDGEMGFRLRRRTFAGMGVSVPLRGANLKWPEGEARFYFGSMGIHVGRISNEARFRLMASLGYYLWFLGAKTNAIGNYDGNSTLQVTTGPSLLLSTIFVVPQKRLGIALSCRLVVLPLQTDYYVKNRKVATVGHFLPGISVSLVWLPRAERK